MNDEVVAGRRLAELFFGARLAVSGGRKSWARLALTAVGIGLGVAVLLVAASLGTAQQAKSDRVAGRTLEPASRTGTSDSQYLLARTATQQWRGEALFGYELAAVGQPRLPGGLDTIPAPGEIVLSPAMATLLAAPGNEQLRVRFPERVVGTIADQGLTYPHELLFYAGLDPARSADPMVVGSDPSVQREDGFDEVMQLLVAAATVALLVPIGVFVLVATRIGAGLREQRLASIRLVGADAAQTRWISAGEALAGAAFGLLLGAVVFLAIRPLARLIELQGAGFFPSDLVPSPGLALLIVVAVPVTAVAAALIALRRLEIGPLGVVRAGTLARRRLGWRLALLGAGAAILGVVGVIARHEPRLIRDSQTLLVCVGIGLVLAGAAAMVPWVTDMLATRLRPTPVACLLAVRRLRFDSSAVRVVSGVATVLAGALALQIMLASISVGISGRSSVDRGKDGSFELYANQRSANLGRLADVVRAVPGVSRVSPVATSYVQSKAGTEPANSYLGITFTDCAEITRLLVVTDCAPGRAYLAGRSAALKPGDRAQLQVSSVGPTSGLVDWVLPAWQQVKRRADLPQDGTRSTEPNTLMIAVGAAPLPPGLSFSTLWVSGEPDPTLAERVLTAVAPIDRTVHGSTSSVAYRESEVGMFDSLRGAVLVALMVVTLLAALSLLVAAVEQLQERRRAYAVLAASGVAPRTLALATLWQNGIATLIGLVVALPVGFALAKLALLAISRSNNEFVVHWGDVGMTVGVAAALALLVTVLTLPALRSAIRPSALRFE